MVKLIVLPNRSELPLELVFTPDINLASHNGESVALYISGCPAMHLFELILISLESSEEPEIYDCYGMLYMLITGMTLMNLKL